MHLFKLLLHKNNHEISPTTSLLSRLMHMSIIWPLFKSSPQNFHAMLTNRQVIQ